MSGTSGLATLPWSMIGCFDHGISLSSWNSKLGGSCILPLLHPRPTNGPHSSCAKQHPGVRVRSISFTIATANMLRTFRLWPPGSGIKELRTPYRAPRANGICERYMGSLRRECLNHALILNDRHLLRVVREYTKYFNQERPHQGIGQRIPDHYDRPVSSPTGNISSKAFLGGLHHSYSRVACPK